MGNGATEREPKIKAVKTTFRVVKTLMDQRGAKVVDLADRMDLPVSTVFDHLDTLETLGYVIKQDGEYRVSSKFLKVGNESRAQREIYHVSKVELDSLSRRTGEHVAMMVEEKGYGVYLYVSAAENHMQTVAYPGTRTALHATAPGKAMLAYMSPHRTERLLGRTELSALTGNTITDREELMDELERIRERKYALDEEEGLEGLFGISMPVLNRIDGKLRGAVCIYSPAGETIEQFVDEMLGPLQRTVNTIEINLAYGQ